jgi:ribosome-associated protein
MIQITNTIILDENEIQLTFIHAAGPGGQNVNKTSTAVQLFFDVVHSPHLPEDVRQRLLRLAGNRLTQEGVLVIEANQFRTQHQNRQDALDRLADLIRQAAVKPKRRIKTRVPAEQKKRRLASKQRRSEIKRLRTRVSRDHDD